MTSGFGAAGSATHGQGPKANGKTYKTKNLAK